MTQQGTKICKICGKEYEYCKTKAHGAFRWQDVACCVEHANQYFEEIAISRGEKKPKETKQVEKENKDAFAKADFVNKKNDKKEKK